MKRRRHAIRRRYGRSTASAPAADYGAVQQQAYGYWMDLASKPSLLRSMSAAEHKAAATKAEAQAIDDEHEAQRHDAKGNVRAAHEARLNGAKTRAFAEAHRELMGRKFLSPVGGS